MPLPTPGDVHVNSLLTDVSVAFMQDANKFVADRVFPRINVEKQSDKYATYSQADFMRDDMKRRAPGSETAGGRYRVSTDSYQCEVWGYHIDVDDQTVANADNPFNPMRDAAQVATMKEMLAREVQWASSYFTTSVWTGGLKASGSRGDLVAGTDFTAFDDVSSTPIETISDQMVEVEAITGYLPNKLVLTRRGFMALKNHPDIVDRIKHVSDGPVTTGMIARLLDLEEIMIAAAVKNSAQEGLTGSYDYIMGNHALLLYTTPTPSLLQATAGYTFVWSGYTGAVDGRRVKSYRLEHLNSERIEIEATWDQKVVSSTLGVFFQNIVS